MKKHIRASILAVPALVAAVAFVAFAGVPAEASGAPSSTSSTSGIVDVCPGVSYNSLTDVNGAPLTKDELRSLAEHAKFKCDHPSAGPTGSYTAANGGQTTVTSGKAAPMHTETPYGYVNAYLYNSPGVASYFAEVGNMPTSYYKTVSCEITVNGGAWNSCGQVAGYDSYLSTAYQSFCPAYAGMPIEVVAWLDIAGAQYWDSSSGYTQ